MILVQQILSHRCRKKLIAKGEGIRWETEIDIYTLLYVMQITNKDLPQSTGDSTQYSVIAYLGQEFLKENEIMLFAATWMDLEIVILSEVSQTEKEKYCMTSLIYRI